MKEELDALLWPVSRVGDAMEAVARHGSLTPRRVELPPAPATLSTGNDDHLARWIGGVADYLGLEAQRASSSYTQVTHMIRRAGPALLEIERGDERRFLAVVKASRGSRVAVLGPDLAIHHIGDESVRSAVCKRKERLYGADLEQLLDKAGVAPRRRQKVRRAVLRERLGAEPIGGCWMLRAAPTASFWTHLRLGSAWRYLALLVGAHAIAHLLLVLSWWMVGRGALTGHFDLGWLAAWALLLLTLIPFRVLVSWTQGRLAYGVGGLVKQRLLAGAVRLDPQAIRHQGAGQLLGRVMESEAIETMALTGGFLGLVAVTELVVAALVLAAGPSGWLHVAILGGWLVLLLAVSARYARIRRLWTGERVGMTYDLVERLVGHRTRLAQEVPERWHDGEDQVVRHYLDQSASMDRAATLLLAVMVRGWTILGLCSLTPSLVAGDPSPVSVAIGLGGVLVAARALEKLNGSITFLIDAGVSWEQVAPLFEAAARSERDEAAELSPALMDGHPGSSAESAILEAHDVVFRYRPQGAAVLRGCDLTIQHGDRLLLEGPSGGGKSTLASLIFGLRAPESGLLLLRGLDRQTLGLDGWRRVVVAAPQFHENHIFSGTFAFNLLMGRDWPPTPQDLSQAEEVCRELGLGDLLDRMPARLQQMVGETGWQLSHGEKSRIYIARALLQRAELVLLDESFASLDPQTVRNCLACVNERAKTLLVIAHP